MSKVLFLISYAVKPELRDQYLQFTSELKAHFAHHAVAMSYSTVRW